MPRKSAPFRADFSFGRREQAADRNQPAAHLRGALAGTVIRPQVTARIGDGVTIRADGHGEIEKNLQVKKGEVRQVDLVLPPRGTPPPAPAPKAKTPPRTKP